MVFRPRLFKELGKKKGGKGSRSLRLNRDDIIINLVIK